MIRDRSLSGSHLRPRRRRAYATYLTLAMLLIIFAVQNKTVLTFLRFVHNEAIAAASTTAVHIAPPMEPFQSNGVTIFEVPINWNRFETPWFRPPKLHLQTAKESKFRFLYSSTRLMTSDGIGHSMGIVNYEVNMARRFNITYTHRVGIYSSLSKKDRFAVEQFFGWGHREIPRTLIQEEGCHPKGGIWPHESIYQCHVCQSAKKNGALRIKSLVQIPEALGPLCARADPRCHEKTKGFLNHHNRSHSIFQLPISSCSPPASDSDYLHTKDYFFHKYWDRHGRLPWLGLLNDEKQRRTINYSQDELNVAIHVRRGDFLQEKTRAIRKITSEDTFATVLKDALEIVQDVGGAFADMKVAVHVYSEGKLVTERVSSTHSVDMQDKTYYDMNGVPRSAEWWHSKVSEMIKNSSNSLPEGFENHVRFVLHISEDTLKSLHEMVSADIFIGSVSGLSVNLVWSLARGVLLVPHYTSIINERRQKGPTCCSIPFLNENGTFDKDEFRKYWGFFSEANQKSASVQLHRSKSL